MRATMAKAMPSLAKAVGPKVTAERIVPELRDLLDDEEVSVRLATLRSLSEVKTAMARRGDERRGEERRGEERRGMRRRGGIRLGPL